MNTYSLGAPLVRPDRVVQRPVFRAAEHHRAHLLRQQTDRIRRLHQPGARLVVQEIAAWPKHCGDVGERKRQVVVIEVGEDIRHDDQIELPVGQPFGDDVHPRCGHRPGDRGTHADRALKALVGCERRRRFRLVANRTPELLEVGAVVVAERHVAGFRHTGEQVQQHRRRSEPREVIDDARVDVHRVDLERVRRGQ